MRNAFRIPTRLMSASLVAALAVTAVGTTGCFGKFALTRKVYGWNDSLGNKFVKTLVFWGLIIVPVYEIAGAADYFILNLIEFWTGSNPVADNRDIQSRELEDGSVEIRYAGAVYHLVPTGDQGFELHRNSKLVGQASLRFDGSLELSTEKGVAVFHQGEKPVGSAVAQR